MSAEVSAEDRLGIMDLFARYTWAYDRGDADAYAEAFVEDGEMGSGDGAVKGRAAIVDMIKTYFARRGADGWQHHNDHLHIEMKDGRAVVHSYWIVLEHIVDGDTHRPRTLGFYVTECVKKDGVWYIARRVTTQTPFKGIPMRRSAS